MVVAVEMMPETFDRLRAHVDLNSCTNVRLVNRALADRRGQSVSVVVPAGGRHGLASIAAAKPDVGNKTVQIETETLDELLEALPRIKLIKLDIEGAEKLAIQGARKILSRVENIVFERWDEEHDLTALLQEQGFRVRALSARNAAAER
jgi:FkbM family methyltransferase